MVKSVKIYQEINKNPIWVNVECYGHLMVVNNIEKLYPILFEIYEQVI